MGAKSETFAQPHKNSEICYKEHYVELGLALTYGIGQGVSWLYNGKTLEENVGRRIGL